MQAFCTSCGTALNAGSTFCTGCGVPGTAAAASAQPVRKKRTWLWIAGLIVFFALGFWLGHRMAPKCPACPTPPTNSNGGGGGGGGGGGHPGAGGGGGKGDPDKGGGGGADGMGRVLGDGGKVNGSGGGGSPGSGSGSGNMEGGGHGSANGTVVGHGNDGTAVGSTGSDDGGGGTSGSSKAGESPNDPGTDPEAEKAELGVARLAAGAPLAESVGDSSAAQGKLASVKVLSARDFTYDKTGLPRYPDAKDSSPVPARWIRGDLDAIVSKTLRKEPAHRYATVEALKSDVIQFLHGEPVEARKHARLYRLGHALRHYRWPLGAAAAAALLLVAGWRLIPRPTPAAASGHTVALVGFTNLSGPEEVPWLPAALTEMVGTELSSADTLRVVPQELVRDVTQSVKPSASGYDLETLRRLGRNLDADYIISGHYLAASAAGDSPLRIDIALQDVHSGIAIARFSQQASLGNLPDLVSRIGVKLRRQLGVGAPTPELLAQISNAQPPTVDVAQKLSLAGEAMQRFDAAKARDELLQVIAQSPGYAPAYASLSDAWSALGYREKAVAAAQQAVARGSALPTDMQLQIDAALQAAEYQWAKASNDWNALIKLKPQSPEYRLQAINTSLAAGARDAASLGVTELRRLPGISGDPRVELAAARVACALDDAKGCAERAQEALRLALLIGAPGLTADARDQLAVAQMHLGNFDAASENLRAAVDAYGTIGNPHGEANARRTLGQVLMDQNHVQEAHAQYQRAMAIGQSIGDLGGVSAVYRDLCELLWQDGDRDGAQAAAKRGLELSRETGDLNLQAWTLRALATIAADESANDEVMRNYREVTALTERSGDRGGHVWSLATYADMSRLRGEMTEARTNCTQALTEAAQLTDPQFMIYTRYSCALVEMDLGHADVAADMLAQVQRASEASKNPIYLGNAYQMLAQIDLEQGHCDKALPRLGNAIDVFGRIEAKTGQAEAEALRAACYQQLGNAHERDAAMARLKALRTAITSQLEIYNVDIVSTQLGFAQGRQSDAIAKLDALAADAANRHWLRWSLEARLAAWQLAQATHDAATAGRLRKDLEKTARSHAMGRILARIQQLST